MQNPPKRWEIFISKKGCEDVYEFSRIFQWFCRKNDGVNGDLEVPVGELEGVKRAFYRKWKKEEKKEKRSKGVSWPKEWKDESLYGG